MPPRNGVPTMGVGACIAIVGKVQDAVIDLIRQLAVDE
jgi:hypothetical protein